MTANEQDLLNWYDDALRDAHDTVAQEEGYANWQAYVDAYDQCSVQGVEFDGPAITKLLERAMKRVPLTQEVADAIARRTQQTLNLEEEQPMDEDYIGKQLRSDERVLSVVVDDADGPDVPAWVLAALYVLVTLLGLACLFFMLAQPAYASDSETVINDQTVVQCSHCEINGLTDDQLARINRRIRAGERALQQQQSGLQQLQRSFSDAEDTFYSEFEEMGGGIAGAYAMDSVSMNPNGGWQIGAGAGTFRGEFFAGAIKIGGPLSDDAFLTAGAAADGSTVSGAVGVTIQLGR